MATLKELNILIKDYFYKNNADYVEPYTKPKPKKKLKLVRHILKNKHADLYVLTQWQSYEFISFQRDFKIVGTEEMEVEVDE